VDKSAETLACSGVPESDEAVGRAGDDESSVTDDVDAGDRVRVGRKRAHDARGSDVPEEHGFVVGSADKHVAFGREGDGVYVVVMAEEEGGMRFALEGRSE
jgi:hypothetical protein